MADAAARARSDRPAAAPGAGPPAERHPGPGRLVGRARGPGAEHVDQGRRRRPCPGRRRPHQDLGDARDAPPAHARGRRGVPVAARRRPALGATGLAALLRHGPGDDGTLPPRRPRRARRADPDPRGVDRGGHGRARARAHRRRPPIRLGHAPQADRVAGRPVLRATGRQPRHVHAARSGIAALGRDPRSRCRRSDRRRRLRPRVRPGDRVRLSQLAVARPRPGKTGRRLVRRPGRPPHTDHGRRRAGPDPDRGPRRAGRDEALADRPASSAASTSGSSVRARTTRT